MNGTEEYLYKSWKMRLVCGVAFLLLLNSSCAHKGDWAHLIEWPGIEISQLPGETEFPAAGAIMVLDSGKMEVIGSGEIPLSHFERRRIVKILNYSGLRYANITIPYAASTEIEAIRARTITPDGAIHVLDEDEIFDVTLYPGFIFYSDQRAKIFTMPAVERGAIIEYSYRLKIGNRSLWPSWRFQADIPTLNSSFTMVAPSEWEVTYKHYDIDIEPVIEEAPSGFKSKYSWTAKNIPALPAEYGMPSGNEVGARLEVVPVGFETWDDVGKWYHQLSKARTASGVEVKALTAKLITGAESDEEKLRRIYEWVRDNIRYIAVSIGIGGFQPHAAEEVLVHRYGDCKDMTTLLCALAREAGIEAEHVLISTWQNGAPDTSMSSPYQFNHAIAHCPTVGEHGIWMDATEKGCPFGQLPWYDQNTEILAIDESGNSEIKKTPSVHPGSNRAITDWSVRLRENGAAVVRGRTQLTGALATELREDLLFSPADQCTLWIESYLAQRCQGIQLESFIISGLDEVEDPLEISYSFNTPHFAALRAGEQSFRPGSVLSFELPRYFRARNRSFAIKFKYGTLEELYLSVYIPDGWNLATEDYADTLSAEFGSASWQYTTTRRRIIRAHEHYLIKGEAIPPEKYNAFQEFIDAIKAREMNEIVIRRKE